MKRKAISLGLLALELWIVLMAILAIKSCSGR